MQKTAGLLGRVILSHHGLHDWVNDDAEDVFRKRTEKETYYAEIMQNLRNAEWLPDVQAALPDASAELTEIRARLKALSPDAETFAFYLGMLERLLQSVLIDADRTDTADFMAGTATEAEFDTLQLWQEMQERMQQKLDSFADKTDPISLQRKSISDRCAS